MTAKISHPAESLRKSAHRPGDGREMHYLRHLARLGAADIHPLGAAGSRALIEAMNVGSGQTLLELGCGTGNTVLRLARRADVFVVGIDLLPEMLLAARHRLRRVTNHSALIRTNASHLPFRDMTFDRVYAESSLGIQDEPVVRNVLRESFRVLKPGGVLVANEGIWKADVDRSTVAAINRSSEVDFGLRPASENAWSLEHWLVEFEKAGFATVTSRHLEVSNGQHARRVPFARWLKRLRLISSPSLISQHYKYRRLLAVHRAHGSLIESRLFVATKAF